MSLQSVGRKLVEMCNQGKNFEVMRTLYAPDVVSVESGGEETSGQAPVIHKSEVWQSINTIHSQKVRGPYFNGPAQFAVHYTFEVTPKASGQRVAREEVGVYTVKDDKIAREQFFYDGRTLGPVAKRAATVRERSSGRGTPKTAPSGSRL